MNTENVQPHRSILSVIVDLHRDLIDWIVRKPLQENEHSFTTMKGNIALPYQMLITILIPIEIVLIAFLIPPDYWAVSLIIKLLSIAVLILCWSFYASLIRRPIVVTGDTVWLRWGGLINYPLSVSLIESVKQIRKSNPTGQFGVIFYPPKGSDGYLTNSMHTNVTLRLRHPIHLPTGGFGSPNYITRLHLGVDNPAEFTQVVNERLHTVSEPEVLLNSENALPQTRSQRGGLSLVLINLAFQILFLVLAYFWLVKQERHISELITPTISGTIIGLIVASCWLLAALWIYYYLSPRLHFLRAWRKWTEEQLLPFLAPAGTIALIIISVTAGIGEELFFRGAMQPVLGTFLSAFIFAAIHVGGFMRREALPLFGYAFLWGLIAGWLFEILNELWPLIVAHSLINFVLIIVLRKASMIRIRKS